MRRGRGTRNVQRHPVDKEKRKHGVSQRARFAGKNCPNLPPKETCLHPWAQTWPGAPRERARRRGATRSVDGRQHPAQLLEQCAVHLVEDDGRSHGVGMAQGGGTSSNGGQQ